MGDLAIFGFGDGGWGLALLEGALMTLLVSACGLLIGAAIGGLVAWARLSGKLIAGGVGQAYAALFRGLPELLIVYFVYFGSSALLTGNGQRSRSRGLRRRAVASRPARSPSASSRAPIRRRCSAAAYLAISRGELEAAVSVGMNRALLFRRIIAPQVLRFALPGLGNLWQVALKDSSLISVTGLTELMRDQPGRRRLDPSALRLLSRRRRALSRDDALRRPASSTSPRRAPPAACAGRRAEAADGLRFHLEDLRPPARRAAAHALGLVRCRSSSAALIAAGVTWMRVSGSSRSNWFARAYVMVFRGTPLLIQLFVVYYGLASLPAVRASFALAVPARRVQLRGAGARALHRRLSGRDLSRRAACRAAWPGRGGARLRHVGLLLFRRIIFPIALRHALPAYSTEMISMVKSTALVSLVTLWDVMSVALKIRNDTLVTYLPLILAGAIYFVVNYIIGARLPRARAAPVAASAGRRPS